MVKTGYKQTEIGVLPADWEVKSFSQVGDYYKGKGISMNDTKTSGFPCIMYGDIYVKFDTHFSHCDYYIDQLTAQQSVKANPEDLFFTASGETAEDIGRCVSYQGTEPIYIGGDIIAIHPYSTYNSLFLSYVQNSVDLKRQKASFAQGHSVVHISSESIKKCKFACPLLPEQKAIATALSDIDSLIDSLEKLIAKKKAIKQGAMQELLTGKRRLPGFTGEWKEWTIEECSDFFDNQRIPVAAALRTKGNTPYYGANGILDYVEGYTHDGEYVLIAEDGANSLIDYPVLYSKGKIWVNNHAHVISGKRGIAFSDYIAYALKMVDFQGVLVGGTRAKLNSKTLKHIKLLLPELDEQRKIVIVLRDMDSEIEKLEKNLSKYKNIKSGMMSELLTGRIRLV